MRDGSPLRTGVRSIRIPERNMNARVLLVLKDLADHIFQIDVRADGEFTDAVTVGISVRVLPEVVLQFSIFGVGFGQPISFTLSSTRRSSSGARASRVTGTSSSSPATSRSAM